MYNNLEKIKYGKDVQLWKTMGGLCLRVKAPTSRKISLMCGGWGLGIHFIITERIFTQIYFFLLIYY